MTFRDLTRFIVLCCAISVPAGPVSWYGALKTRGVYLQDQKGVLNVQLKGPSLYWSTLDGAPFYNERTVDFFVDSMDISVIRASMAIKDWSLGKTIYDGKGNFGYLSAEVPDAKTRQKALIQDVVQAAIRNDIYVIVDWHSPTAAREQAEAIAFFTEMGVLYKDVPNVIFEIYNEPYAISFSTVYAYSRAVIAAIRKTGNNNLILVGSPDFSSHPNQMADMGLNSEFANIAYTLHFGATDEVTTGGRAKAADSAIQKQQVVVFASQWSGGSSAGGNPNVAASGAWMNWMDNREISSCYWAVSASSDPESIWGSQADRWTLNGLTESGRIFHEYMKMSMGSTRTGYPIGQNLTLDLVEGDSVTVSLADLKATTGASVDSVFGVPEGMGRLVTDGRSITYKAPALADSGWITANYVLDLAGKTNKSRLSLRVHRKPRVPSRRLPIAKNRAAEWSVADLGIADPDGDSVVFVSGLAASGSFKVSADKKRLQYTPAPGLVGAGVDSVELAADVVVSDGRTQGTGKLTFVVKNTPPTAHDTAFSVSNQSTLQLGLADFAAMDVDVDSLSFAGATLGVGYPGRVLLDSSRRSLVYEPDPRTTSAGGETVSVQAAITDGTDTLLRTVSIDVTGAGAAIHRNPTRIGTRAVAALGIAWIGRSSVRLDLPAQGETVLEIYRMDGRREATCLRGVLPAGSHEVALPADLGSGIHHLRLRQEGREATTRLFWRN